MFAFFIIIDFSITTTTATAAPLLHQPAMPTLDTNAGWQHQMTIYILNK
jgi:hypothetical protein